MMTNAFGKKMEIPCGTRTELPDKFKRFSSYQFGGQNRIYIEQLVYKEDLYYYAKAIAKTELENAEFYEKHYRRVLKESESKMAYESAYDWIGHFNEQHALGPRSNKQSGAQQVTILEVPDTGKRRNSLDDSDLSNSIFPELEVDVIIGLSANTRK